METYVKQAEIIHEARKVLLEKKIREIIEPYIVFGRKGFDKLIRTDNFSDLLKLKEIASLNKIEIKIEPVNKNKKQNRKYGRGYVLNIYHNGTLLKSLEYDV